MRPECIEQARDIFRKYALREDGNEPGSWEHRLEFKPIEDALGSAIGYIAKYIFEEYRRLRTGWREEPRNRARRQDLKEMSLRVSAWASCWSIRQFQQIGGAPVTVYRELRRLGDRELVLYPELEPARQAANGGEWDNYVLAQGGPLVERDKRRIRLNYETTENGNAYGDDVQRITGIYCPISSNDSLIFTRTTQYKIVPKRQSADGMGVDVGFSGGNVAPGSSVNNCTRDPATGANGLGHADHEVGDTVNFDALSRQEKRELAQRLSNDVRSKRKMRPQEREEGAGLSVKEQQTNELLTLRGIEASLGMIKSIIAGAHIGYGDLSFAVKDGRLTFNNRLDTNFKVATKQKMASILDRDRILARLKKALYAK